MRIASTTIEGAAKRTCIFPRVQDRASGRKMQLLSSVRRLFRKRTWWTRKLLFWVCQGSCTFSDLKSDFFKRNANNITIFSRRKIGILAAAFQFQN